MQFEDTGGGAAGLGFDVPSLGSDPFGVGGFNLDLPTISAPSTGGDPFGVGRIAGDLPTATTPATTGGGSWADSALPWVKLGLGGAQAATTGLALSQAGDLNQILRRAQQSAQEAAAPSLAAAKALIPAGTSATLGGPLPEGLEAEVTQWKDGATAQVNQFFASHGLLDSEMHRSALAQIEQQALMLRERFAQGLLTSGEETATGAVSAAGQAGSSAAGQSTQISTALAEANKQLFALLGATA